MSYSESNPNAEQFDVFLCHNSEDKPEIRQIADELSRRGLKPWLDEREIPPGRVWQEILEAQIEMIKAAAFFAGDSGMGHWQNEEIRACLQQFRDRRRPIIPVILPSATKTPKFPIFLQNRHHVDFRTTNPNPFTQLIWGVTGKKPDCHDSTISSSNQAQPSPDLNGNDLFPSRATHVIEVRVPGSVDDFTPEQQATFMQSLNGLLKLGEVKVIRVVKGSIRLYLELDQGDADKLYNANKEGRLNELSISDVRLYPAIAISPDHDQRRSLLILLDRVREYWVEGVFHQSLYREVLITLGKYVMDEAVEPPWKHVVSLPDERRHLLLQDRNINTVFSAMGLLLILGEPGSGKTTSLLQLADALTVRAKSDPKERVPIVLNLSSWKLSQSLAEWMVVELWARYRVPLTMGKEWLTRDYLLPLLDGLDEVQTAVQPDCVAAINQFIDSNKPSGLVVCCRLTEYQWLPERLKLNGAVCLEPLTAEDVNSFLEAGGAQLRGLQQALSSDPVLQELAETPLMLSIMSLACEGIDSEILAFDKSDSPKDRRDQIFRLYVNRMFKRKGATAGEFSKGMSIHWLSWLARKMKEQSQSVFMVEELQPYWLSTRGQWLAYEAVSSLGIGLLSGLAIGLVSGLFIGLSNGLTIGVFTGLVLLLLRWKGLESVSEIHPVEAIRWEWKLFWKNIWSTLKEGRSYIGQLAVVAAVTLVYMGLQDGFDRPLFRGINWLVVFVIIPGIGLIFMLLAGISEGLSAGFVNLVRADKAFPNQGISLSLKNGLVTLLYGGTIGGIVGGLVIVPDLLRGNVSEDIFMMPLLLAAIFGLRVGFRCGGSAVIKHCSLRLILWLTGSTPSVSQFIPFLDHCAKLILLKKVGGGYMFIHRTLLEYFAGLQPQAHSVRKE